MATLAATASFAQSTVTITGVIDAGYFATTQPGDYKTNYVGQNGARTTAFKFIGNEDLGGGMSANFLFETDPNLANNGNTSGLAGVTAIGTASANSGIASNPSGLVGKGEAWVGLKDNNLGEVKLGSINTNTFRTYAAVSAMGTGIGSGYASTGYIVPNITRYESSASYDSPVWNGLSFGVIKGTGNQYSYGTTSAQVNARSSVLDYALTYANGPLTVKYAALAETFNTATTAAATAANTSTLRLLGGVYDAGVAKVSYATGTKKNDLNPSTQDIKLSLASVTVPFMGSYRFIAQTQTATYNLGAGSTQNGDKNKSTGLGLEKDLSKRTFVYIRNENANVAANAASGYLVNGAALSGISGAQWGSASPKLNITAIGVSHSF